MPTGTRSTTSLAAGAGAILPGAVAAASCPEVLPVAVVDQGIEPGHRFDHDVAAIAAVAAVGTAELDEFLAPERQAAVAAVAALHQDLGFVEEAHVGPSAGK